MKWDKSEYPKTRQRTWCPMCGNDKVPPNLMCAPCARGFKALEPKDGVSLPAKVQLDKCEAKSDG